MPRLNRKDFDRVMKDCLNPKPPSPDLKRRLASARTHITDHPALSTHPEQQYLDLLRELLDAPVRQTRNDDATRSVFGRTMRFDLAHGFPLLTTKKVFWRGVVAELLWFLSGSTNAKVLEDQGITIWKQWGPESREMGPIYGAQMRFWGRHQSFKECGDDWNAVDQVGSVLQGLRDDPYGRRHVMTLWNPADLPDMALPPCHGIAIQFYVGVDGRLSLFMHQRSGDAFLGIPFNIASYALLLEMFAAVLDREPGEFVHSIGDLHLYGNHVEQAREQVSRAPRAFPKLNIVPVRADMDSWTAEDFTLVGYEPHPAIKAEVSA